MTLLTNYNSGSHLFYGWAPKTFHFLVLQNNFFYSLTTLIYSLAIPCYLQSFFSHFLTDSLHKPFSCVISIIPKNGYSPHFCTWKYVLALPFCGHNANVTHKDVTHVDGIIHVRFRDTKAKMLLRHLLDGQNCFFFLDFLPFSPNLVANHTPISSITSPPPPCYLESLHPPSPWWPQ